MTADTTQTADKLFIANKMAAALPYYVELLSASPGDNPLRLKLAICQFRTGDFAPAEKNFRIVTSKNMQNHNAWYYLGLCCQRQGRVDDAKTAYQFALTVKPDFDLARKKLGSDEAVQKLVAAAEVAARPAMAASKPAPRASKAPPPDPSGLFDEDTVARGIYSQPKNPATFWMERIMAFIVGLVGGGLIFGIIGAVIGLALSGGTGDVAIGIGLIAAFVGGVLGGFVNAGNVRRLV